jgi:hypothetical protein
MVKSEAMALILYFLLSLQRAAEAAEAIRVQQLAKAVLVVRVVEIT